MVARHLNGEPSAGRDICEETRKQGPVVVEPLQRRIAEQKIGRLGRVPGRDIGLDEGEVRKIMSRRRQHGRRGIDARGLGARPAFGQQDGGLAAAAAEIVNRLRRLRRNAGEKIGRRPLAGIGEAMVLGRIPAIQNGPFGGAAGRGLCTWAEYKTAGAA